MVKEHVAIIQVSKKALLDWIQFGGGTILGVYDHPEYYNSDILDIKLSHPDLPEVNDGDCLYTIKPTYRIWKRGRFIKMVRLEPPKRGQ